MTALPSLSDLRSSVAQCSRGLAALLAVGSGALGLAVFPGMKLSLLAGGAAQLAGLLLGSPVSQVESGWLLSSRYEPVLVSGACSGADFWLMVVAVLAWQGLRSNQSILTTAALALVFATPLAIAVNAVRVIAVVQAHRWLIPLWPDDYAAFLHQLAGVAVFLPALIFLHALLESRRTHRLARAG